MQIFSPESRELFSNVMQSPGEELRAVALWFVLLQLVHIASFWIGSKVVAEGEHAAFGKALRVYFTYIVAAVAVGVIAAMIAPMLVSLGGPSATHGLSIALVVTLALTGLLLLVVLFVVPMQVYEIRLPAAIGFVLISTAISGAGHLALRQTIGKPGLRKESHVRMVLGAYLHHQSGSATANAAGSPAEAAEKAAADHSKTILERQAALKVLYTQLETAFQALPPSDYAARAEYDQRKARYERLLSDLRAEAAVQAGKPAAH